MSVNTHRFPPLRLVVETSDAGKRLDAWLVTQLPGWSRERVRGLLREGRVSVDGVVRRTGLALDAGAMVVVHGVPPPGEPLPLASPELPLIVVLEREGVLALDKPAGLPTLPLAPDDARSLASALVARHPECRAVGGVPLEAGLLHRLDNETSGLVLAARTADAYAALSAQLERGELWKTYLALVEGQPPEQGVIGWPLAHASDRRRMRVVREGDAVEGARPAETHFRVLERREGRALLEVRLHTGARHQIRAHLAALGYPLAGDELYGARPGPLQRHFLHASRLELRLPLSRADVVVELGLPSELVRWLNLFARIA